MYKRQIFDQVVESASEFSGSGPVEGLGSGVSDSIPARLSDGEFVFTAKATEEIGEDILMSMMKDAEASADQRRVAGLAQGYPRDSVGSLETPEGSHAPSQAVGSKMSKMLVEIIIFLCWQ